MSDIPTVTRAAIRVSQVVVLPPFQRKGLGGRMLRAVYKHARSDPKILDVSVEDPSPDFQVSCWPHTRKLFSPPPLFHSLSLFLSLSPYSYTYVSSIVQLRVFLLMYSRQALRDVVDSVMIREGGDWEKLTSDGMVASQIALKYKITKTQVRKFNITTTKVISAPQIQYQWILDVMSRIPHPAP